MCDYFCEDCGLNVNNYMMHNADHWIKKIEPKKINRNELKTKLQEKIEIYEHSIIDQERITLLTEEVLNFFENELKIKYY